MGRPLRYVPEGGSLVEVTVRTIQGRYLLRSDPRGRVNETVIGVAVSGVMPRRPDLITCEEYNAES